METAQLVSAYMRANARRAVAKKGHEAAELTRPEEPSKGSSSDKLEFSSEFTSQDMGLSSGEGATHLNWKRLVEDEDEEKKKKKGEEEDEDSDGWEEWLQKGKGDTDSSKDEGREDRSKQLEDEKKPEEATQDQTPPLSKPQVKPKEKEPAPIAEAKTASSLGAKASKQTKPGVLKPSKIEPGSCIIPGDANDEYPASATKPSPLTTTLTSARIRPDSLAPIAPNQSVTELAPELVAVASSLIATPPNEAGYGECVRLLARFGLGALRLCASSNVIVEILDEAALAGHWTLQELKLNPGELPSDGAYVINYRTVLIDRRALLEKPRYFHPVLYYFAHAFDHAQGGDVFSSRKAAAVVACFEVSTKGQTCFSFVDELAAADPVRYFARSIAVFLGRDDCDEPLWSHQDLYDFDRSMYDYLQYLFQRLSK